MKATKIKGVLLFKRNNRFSERIRSESKQLLKSFTEKKFLYYTIDPLKLYNFFSVFTSMKICATMTTVDLSTFSSPQ